MEIKSVIYSFPVSKNTVARLQILGEESVCLEHLEAIAQYLEIMKQAIVIEDPISEYEAKK